MMGCAIQIDQDERILRSPDGCTRVLRVAGFAKIPSIFLKSLHHSSSNMVHCPHLLNIS